MPRYLRRTLTLHETNNSQMAAEQANNEYVVWKHGRATHFTYGRANEIKSDYNNEQHGVSAEWMIVDSSATRNWIFSAKGDSGSLVWDWDGFVVGYVMGGERPDSRYVRHADRDDN